VIGFAHTHPLNPGHTTNPSGPDELMKDIGFFVGAKVFPIARYENGNVSINYDW
jgi:hypothetical protein